ncbi:hypothetical protein EVAR_66335_1 [Eumeta japonica]|uniref:Uncharacterized protein n=1 Tax=Eumeta variegata TaxID=151549 RepID=A0A4C1Z4G7_EUMVA|nr:hypothetical protein EVAR_66335_1 [Eumeta japonica]
MWNLCTPRILHNVTEAQKLRRNNWYRKMMQKFASDDSNVYEIVTKAGFTVTIPKPKDSLLCWYFEELPSKRKRSQSVEKKDGGLFLRITAHCATIILEEKKNSYC